ncbi:hypothetical protein [Chroococcidiopsis sp. CCMEE 29]|uniref:hypothetical protein n=1 Tax=Chroococcidiopsis sp. CCMEE 29 TaxID=155894 RepID=UPI002020B6C4|nr:hypothetical protein [Chroococcidiopsis sp. CCMEE 29]
MPKTKSRYNTTSGSYETRLAAAQSFNKGDRIRHKITGKQGLVQEINLGFALPEVWVQFESDNEILVPASCNPLQLELMNSEFNQEKIPSVPELEEAEAIPLAAVEVLEELTQQEADDRHRLEVKVERAFYEAALALRELHDRKLYRSTHSRFDHYCRERFGFSQQNADLLIRAARVIDNLKVTTIGCNFLPTSERQVRPLTKLGPDEQREVWQQAVEQAGNKVPSGRIVKSLVVERLKEKPLFPAADFCRIGDVFILTRLEGNESRYNRCPCTAVELKNFTVEVDVYDATLLVKPENLKPIDSPDARRQLPQTLKRIKRLRNVGLLDRGAYNVLEDLGQQIYLTDLEEKLLTFLEKEYGIESRP